MTNPVDHRDLLLIRAASRFYAGLPLTCVVETMRPLPCAPLAGAHPVVLGAAVVRGRPTPVVDLARALGVSGGSATRFVTVRAGRRVVVLAVEGVIGVRQLAAVAMDGLPPLATAGPGPLAELGVLDRELLALLEAGRIVSEEDLARLDLSVASPGPVTPELSS